MENKFKYPQRRFEISRTLEICISVTKLENDNPILPVLGDSYYLLIRLYLSTSVICCQMLTEKLTFTNMNIKTFSSFQWNKL